MTVAFTSDAKARWASEWLAWPDFGPFWAQVVRHPMRKNESRGIFVDIESSDASAKVMMDTVDAAGRFIDQAETKLTVIGPRLKTEKIPMHQTAPGRYEGTIETKQRGAYQIDLAQKRGDTNSVRQSRGLVVGYPDELRLRPTDTETLKRIAKVSGGSFDQSAAQIMVPGERTARLPIPLWPYLLMLALPLFVIDVALRRVDLAMRR